MGLTITTLIAAAPTQAQDVEVPRTRTLPGIASPAFPYAQPEEVGLSSEKLERLSGDIVEWVANGELVGAELLIIKNGRAVFHEAYGWSDRERRIPVERNSIWSIKSMSKPFTATAVLMLAEEDKLSLDDPVRRYLPRFAGDERTTIRHLLSHTSGYRNEDLGDPIPGVHLSFREWVEDWASRTPTGTLGEYEYTDFGFAASGYIVEKVTGVPIGEFTEERIVLPLGLEDTRTFFTDDPAWRARLNPWYRWNEEGGGYELRWTKDFRGWRFYPAAWGMFSTAMDYAEFMGMWMNQGKQEDVRLLREETVEEALEPHALVNGYGMYGYGWAVSDAPGAMGDMPVLFEHGGGDGTQAMAFPESHAMVIYMTHSRYGSHRGALANRLGTLGIFDHPGPGLLRVDEHELGEVELSPEERARYIGTYAVGRRDGGIAQVPRVWEEDGRLRIRLGMGGAKAEFRFDLVPLGGGRFALGRYEDGQAVAFDPIYGVRFTEEDGLARVLELAEGDRVLFSAERADSAEIRTRIEAEKARVSLAQVISRVLEAEGIPAARARHRDLLAARPDSVRFGESLLNALGYRLLTEDRVQEAIAVFEMNAEAYPEEANPYDSLGDAYRTAGRLEEARQSYERAVHLAEQQGHEDLPNYRRKLERLIEQLKEQQPGI